MGTFAEIVVEADSASVARAGIEDVRDVFERVNRTMSVHRRNSDLTRVNRWAGLRAILVDPWVADLVSKARRASFRTDGAFSIDVLSEGMARGLKPRLVDASPPGGNDSHIKTSLVPPVVYLPMGDMALDLGGIAKGYALDRAREALKGRGLNRFLVSLGRNISVGTPPHGTAGWPVRIAGENRVRRMASITVSVSQQGVRRHTPHIVNPDGSGSPPSYRRIVAVAREGWVADMASTALMVNPDLTEQLRKNYSTIRWVKVETIPSGRPGN